MKNYWYPRLGRSILSPEWWWLPSSFGLDSGDENYDDSASDTIFLCILIMCFSLCTNRLYNMSNEFNPFNDTRKYIFTFLIWSMQSASQTGSFFPVIVTVNHTSQLDLSQEFHEKNTYDNKISWNQFYTMNLELKD